MLIKRDGYLSLSVLCFASPVSVIGKLFFIFLLLSALVVHQVLRTF